MEQIKISKRLCTVAHMVKKGNIVADIGTDHGYLPIYIVKNQISEHVIAMDVRKGPLEKARQNVKAYQVADAIDIRLSDGLMQLKPMEANTITICGMGGRLIQSILTNGRDKVGTDTQLILSPQSEISEFRRFLGTNGFQIQQECMIKEDNQFYLLIECQWNGKKEKKNELPLDAGNQDIFNDQTDHGTENETDHEIDNEIDHEIEYEIFMRYGRTLLEQKDVVLFEYLKHEQKVNDHVIQKLNEISSKDEKILARIMEVHFDQQCIHYALEYFEQ